MVSQPITTKGVKFHKATVQMDPMLKQRDYARSPSNQVDSCKPVLWVSKRFKDYSKMCALWT